MSGVFLLHLCSILIRAEVRASHVQENREKYGGPKIAIWCMRLHIKIAFWGPLWGKAHFWREEEEGRKVELPHPQEGVRPNTRGV